MTRLQPWHSPSVMLFARSYSGNIAFLQVLLSRHTAQDDIAIATPHHNRRHAEVEGVQGCFVNTLAIRVSSAEDPSFQQLLQRVKAAMGGAICHADVPFQAVAEAVAEQRGAAPIHQVR